MGQKQWSHLFGIKAITSEEVVRLEIYNKKGSTAC